MADYSDVLLFAVLARAARRRVDEFTVQHLANTALSFAVVGESTPAMLKPISVLDAMMAQGAEP